MRKLHIVNVDDQFLVVELYNYKENYYSKIHGLPHKTLDLASKYVILMNEDGVPAMASSGVLANGKPQVDTFSPLLRIRKAASNILRRRNPR